MNDNAKKGLLIGVIVLAVIAAIFGATKTAPADKPEVVGHIKAPPGFKSERDKDLERLKQGGASSPAPATGKDSEPDLGGNLGKN